METAGNKLKTGRESWQHDVRHCLQQCGAKKG